MTTRSPFRKRRRAWLGAALGILLAGPAAPAGADVTFVWADDFSPAEQAMLSTWLRADYAAVERLVGALPMGVTLRIHRHDNARGPVPWAHTDRFGGQGVEFYVDPSYPARAFHDDWTAPHELSHLILPFVGRRNAWFAEGFASYMEYQVMEAAGVLTDAEAARRYRQHLEQAADDYPYPRETFVEAAPKLMARHRYPVMYWGGAAYFLQMDQALRDSGSSLVAVLRAYVHCCRRDTDSLGHLLAELDRLAGSDGFTRRYRLFTSVQGFPQVRGMTGD